ncbi:MAG TPA: hypothetical protein VN153_07380 [Tahibacter sp.]|nr:hypothetical protein [Tahibacter sp.]
MARWFGLDWKTVKAVDFQRLQRTLGPVDFSGVTLMAMDEFAIQKGRRYATVVIAPCGKRVLRARAAGFEPISGRSSSCWDRSAPGFAPWPWT